MRERGFTLIELVVVMVVVGILAVTAIPRLFFRVDYDQKGTYDKTVAALQFARKTAIATRHHVCVTLNTAANPSNLAFDIHATDPDTFTGFPAACNGGHLTLPSPDKNCASGVNFEICAPSGITINPGTFSAGTIIVFSPLGSASASGTLGISTGTGSSTVALEAETGYVH